MAEGSSVSNIEVKPEVRPDALMDELGIKRQAYYSYLKHLGLKAQKDSQGKAYLTHEQANLIRQLRQHVQATGKLEGFGALATTTETRPQSAPAQPRSRPQASNPSQDFDMETLIRGAAEIAGHRMTMGEQLMLQIADRMHYEDLPEDVRTKVDSVRQAADPKQQDLSGTADQLLTQWRTRTEQAA